MTSTQTPQAAEPQRQPTGADESPGRFLVRGIVLVFIGGFLGGILGLGVAGAGVAATWKRSARLVAGAAAAVLVAAALATVFEVVPEPGALRSNFATSRPVASALGLTAGVLAIVAVVTMAFRERAALAAGQADTTRQSAEPVLPTLARLRAWLASPRTLAAARSLVPFVTVALVALVVRAASAPDALPHQLRGLASNLRDGAGYVVGSPGNYRATGSLPPVPALLGAFAPGGAALCLAAASVAAVALAMILAHRLCGPRAALVAGITVLVVEVATAQQLPSTAAAAFLLVAAVLGMDETVPPARSALAGATLGLAILCEPWAIVATPLLAAWIVLEGGRGRGRAHLGSVTAASVAVLAAAVTCAPWQRFMLDRFDTFATSTDMAVTRGAVSALLPLAIVAVTVIAIPRLRPDG